MSITIDYSDGVTPQYVIQIPKADLTLIQSTPTEIRQLNINDLRLELGSLKDDERGMAYTFTHVHTPPLTISGVTLARVVEILDPYVVEFEDGLYNVNIVGGNSNVSDKTLKNQVGVNTANSAGLQDPFALQAAAFGQGEVSLDVSAAESGTTFPFGTRAFPVNNVSDALSIASERGLRAIRVLSDMTLSTGDFSDGYLFIGDNSTISMTLDAAPNITNCEFFNLTVTGTLDGGNTLRGCSIQSLNYFNGLIFQCGISGTVTVSGTSSAVFLQCFSLVSGGGDSEYPLINLNGTHETPLVVRDWTGGLGIENATSQTASCSIDVSSGRVIFESDVAAGTYVVRGIGDVEDNSTGGAVISDLTINKDVRFTSEIEGGQWDIVGTQMIFYKPDNVTEIARFNLLDSGGSPTGDPALARRRVRV